MNGTNGFNYIKDKSLNESLTPYQPSRLQQSDIQRQVSLPKKIAEGAKQQGVVEVLYYCNGLAGDFSTLIDLRELDLRYAPLSMAWYLGAIDKNGGIAGGQGGGLMLGGAYGVGTSTDNGVSVAVNGVANYVCSQSEIGFYVSTANVGWPVFITAYFYYAIFYDETEVNTDLL